MYVYTLIANRDKREQSVWDGYNYGDQGEKIVERKKIEFLAGRYIIYWIIILMEYKWGQLALKNINIKLMGNILRL